MGYSKVDNKQSKWSSETSFLSGTGATNVELNEKNVEDLSMLNAGVLENYSSTSGLAAFDKIKILLSKFLGF